MSLKRDGLFRFTGISSDPDREHIQAQNILIFHILGAFINHADARTPQTVFGIVNFLQLGGIEGDAVVLDAQDDIVVIQHHADIHGMGFLVRLEAVLHHVDRHFLQEQGGLISAGDGNAFPLAELHDLIGDLDHIVAYAGSRHRR